MKGKQEEQEIKLELSERLHTEILALLPESADSVSQNNFFFDSPEKRLGQEKWALRLREQGSRFYLTSKGPSHKGRGGVHVRPEIESEVSPDKASEMLRGFSLGSFPLAPCRCLLEKFGDLAVSCFLTFPNTRICAEWQGYTLEFDRTEISDMVFFELELEAEAETIDRARKTLRRWFSKNGWPYVPSRKSKLERALALASGYIEGNNHFS